MLKNFITLLFITCAFIANAQVITSYSLHQDQPDSVNLTLSAAHANEMLYGGVDINLVDSTYQIDVCSKISEAAYPGSFTKQYQLYIGGDYEGYVVNVDLYWDWMLYDCSYENTSDSISITIDLPFVKVEEVEIENLHIFPNPVSDQLVISKNSFTPFEISILNCLGEVVRKEFISSNNSTINCTDLKSGVYFLKGEGVGTKRFIVE